jgi:dienelactone hydrolase
MVISLLSEGDASLLDCGVPCHPAPDPAAYPTITKPSQWHFASHDPFFKPKQIAEVRQKMEGRGVVFEQTVHERESKDFVRVMGSAN